MAEEQLADGPGDGQWLSVAAAARRLGVSPRAIRGRMKRGTIEWRPLGNTGREVLVTSEDAARDEDRDGPADVLDQLREELADLREALGRAEARAESADRIAEARVETAQAEAKMLRELIAELRAELTRARKPWWWRMLGGG